MTTPFEDHLYVGGGDGGGLDPRPDSHPDYVAAIARLRERGPGQMKPDLSRIRALMDLLGNPEQAFPSFHITGTNGKGSTARMIGTLCNAIGLHTGVSTSPHLQSTRERFLASGRRISEPAFADLVNRVDDVAELVDNLTDVEGEVSYFELLTAMTFVWMADVPVDVGVVEVGIGGTWDATSLLRTGVSVIGPVALDHRILGNTPEETAKDKAGIMRDGVPVVIGAQSASVTEVLLEHAREVGAGPVLRLGLDFAVTERHVAVGGQQINLRIGTREFTDVFLPLHGKHQADNAAVAVAAFAAFLGERFDDVDDAVVVDGLAAVEVPGRLETVSADPLIIVDGAHNPHAMTALGSAFTEAFTPRNTVAVVGLAASKDAKAIIEPVADFANHVVLAPLPGSRGISPERVLPVAAEVLDGTGIAVEVADSVTGALDLARGIVKDGDAILVTGSLFLVGAVRDMFLPPTDLGEPTIVDEDEQDPDEFVEDAIDAMLDRLAADQDAARDNDADEA